MRDSSTRTLPLPPFSNIPLSLSSLSFCLSFSLSLFLCVFLFCLLFLSIPSHFLHFHVSHHVPSSPSHSPPTPINPPCVCVSLGCWRDILSVYSSLIAGLDVLGISLTGALLYLISQRGCLSPSKKRPPEPPWRMPCRFFDTPAPSKWFPEIACENYYWCKSLHRDWNYY